MIIPPKPDTIFKKHNDRLSLFINKESEANYWEEYWNNSQYLSNLIITGKQGNLREFQKPIEKYVNKADLILEAGCGPGAIVTALTSRGYKSIGLDNESKVIRFAKSQIPKEYLIIGDVTSVSLPNNCLGTYMSFGVVEHFIKGPGLVLSQAYRLLKKNGVALISVPYLNPIRKKYLKYIFCEDSQKSKKYDFFQYYYSISEFKTILEEYSFNLIDIYPYAIYAFVTREIKNFKYIWNSPFMRYKFQKYFINLFEKAPLFIRKKYGHMIMFICKKRDN